MRHQTITVEVPQGFDFKAAGYLISIASVFFLGAVAWPTSSDPSWHKAALIIGMATSIGMDCHYVTHLQQKQPMRAAQEQARKRD